LALRPLPLTAGLAVLPVIGMALNGTSSVLYGTVPELVAPSRRQRAFTGEVGAVALAPVLYGLASDLADVPTMMMQVAAIGRVTMPLAWRLGPYLQAAAARGT
jgi:MFS transporter, FSR family, fosmidomycin resistance protein